MRYEKFPKFLFSIFVLSLPFADAASKPDIPPAEPSSCSVCGSEDRNIAVAKKAIPTVVFIKQIRRSSDDYALENQQNPFDLFNDDFFNKFFNGPQKGKPRPVEISQGSGFFVSADGYIMTNAHVVKGAEKILVTLHDGRELDASLIGLDTHTDIAIIKIPGDNFPYLPFGDSDTIEIGESVLAVGSPFALQASVTSGIISQKNRDGLRITDVEDFIQTDAAINPGNSGGPLICLRKGGMIIGINTAIASNTGYYSGIGFAVPSNIAKHIMGQIIDNGSVSRGFLGVTLQPIDKDMADAFNLDKPEGVLVSEVVKGSPADKAGLQSGDIIVKYNQKQVRSIGSFRSDVALMKPGAQLVLEVNRKGTKRTITVELGSMSDKGNKAQEIASKLGLEVEELTPELAKQLGYTADEKALVVTKVRPGSPAAYSGLRPGFLILAVNHKKVLTVDDFQESLKDSEAKKRVLILAKHGSVNRYYSIKLE